MKEIFEFMTQLQDVVHTAAFNKIKCNPVDVEVSVSKPPINQGDCIEVRAKITHGNTKPWFIYFRVEKVDNMRFPNIMGDLLHEARIMVERNFQ